MQQPIFDRNILAPENELSDAREIRDAFVERLDPINPIQSFYVNYLVRGAVTSIRAQIMETVELTRAIAVIEKKLESAREEAGPRYIQALAMRQVSRDSCRLEDLLRTQKWGARERHVSLRDIANSPTPPPPPSVPSCRQDLVEDPELAA